MGQSIYSGCWVSVSLHLYVSSSKKNDISRTVVKLPELWPVEMDAESTQIAAVYINELIQ